MKKAPGFPEKIDSTTRVLVVGLGKSGLAAIKLFQKLGAQVRASDNRPAEKIGGNVLEELEARGINFETGGHTEKMFVSQDLVLVSPGVPHDIAPINAAGKAGAVVIGEMGLASILMKTPMVAITGTNGKSTVTKLIGDIFKASGKKVFVGGNIGTPLAEYLAGDQDADAAVLEVSSFQLDTATGFKPKVALLLNISPDHLDRYASYDAYAASKFAIFAAQSAEDVAIVNFDDSEIIERIDEFSIPAKRYFFGAHLPADMSGAFRRGSRMVVQLGNDSPEETYKLSGTGFERSPNFENAMAAVLAARLMGCGRDAVCTALASFAALDHRMSLVAEVDGVKYIDDSKATNIGALQAALKGLDAPVILIAGGRDKGGDYSLLHEIVEQKVKKMLLIGEAKEMMAESFQDLTAVEKITDLSEAVVRAHAVAGPGDIVLLSPACASFDMFASYAQRGEVFAKAVLALKKKAA